MVTQVKEAKPELTLNKAVENMQDIVKIIREFADVAEQATSTKKLDIAADAFIKISESGLLGSRATDIALQLRGLQQLEDLDGRLAA